MDSCIELVNKGKLVHFIKFEELRDCTKDTLEGVFKFLLNLQDIDGTVVQKRIDEVIQLGHDVTKCYSLKPTDGQFNKHFDKFPKALQDKVIGILHKYCQFFGYFKEEGLDNQFAYFDVP